MNEQNNLAADNQPLLTENLTVMEPLADLALTDAQAEATKGGPGQVASFYAFGGFSGGVYVAAGH